MGLGWVWKNGFDSLKSGLCKWLLVIKSLSWVSVSRKTYDVLCQACKLVQVFSGTFILMLVGDVNSGATIYNSHMCGMTSPYVTFIFIDWTETQISFDCDIWNSGNEWSMLENRGWHFIHLNLRPLTLLVPDWKYTIFWS